MNYTLENNHLTAKIQSHGAELSSVRGKSNGREYIWQADPAVWARHAPVLFPIVGKLNGNQYRLYGETYSMSQHGFARDREFFCSQEEDQQLTFQLTADDDTKNQYPFEFRLTIVYTLSGNQLKVTFQVKNDDDQVMPFSIGAHPAFYCPAQEGKHWNEYQLQFEQNETLERHIIENGLRTGQTHQLMDDEHMLALHRHLFEEDAIVFKHPKSAWTRIVDEATGKKIVTVYHKDFSYLGIWQKVGADFYCIEPWLGLADEKDFEGDLTQKEGIQLLEPAQQFEVSYTIEFHE